MLRKEYKSEIHSLVQCRLRAEKNEARQVSTEPRPPVRAAFWPFPLARFVNNER